jgi:hypothetical protein
VSFDFLGGLIENQKRFLGVLGVLAKRAVNALCKLEIRHRIYELKPLAGKPKRKYQTRKHEKAARWRFIFGVVA